MAFETPLLRHPNTRDVLMMAREISVVPKVAWPTLLLFGSGLSTWLFALYLLATAKISAPFAFGIAALAQYMVYTCLHEAVHGNVSQSPVLNDWVGRIASSLLLAPYKGFRHVHLKHHKHTNEEKIDPDLWSAQRPWILAWATQDLFYYVHYLQDRRQLRIWDRVEVVLHGVTLIGLAALFYRFGLFHVFLWAWLLPSRLVILFLSFVFNYLPHLPHDPEIQKSPYTKTNIRESALLTPLLIGQNFHLIHHLYPKAPFYRYPRMYRFSREFLKSQGTRIL